MKGERKLTEAEQKRKENFERLSEEMIKKGYSRKDITISLVAANVLAIVVMLPFILLMGGFYYWINSDLKMVSGNGDVLIILGGMLICLVIHEVIHGITWSRFTPNGMKDIDFGFVISSFTPYCTCSQPLLRWQYIVGLVMPTLILGFGLTIFAAFTHMGILLGLAEVMILGGGGDFIILLKMVLHKSDSKDILYYDHPYECGFVTFEK